MKSVNISGGSVTISFLYGGVTFLAIVTGNGQGGSGMYHGVYNKYKTFTALLETSNGLFTTTKEDNKLTITGSTLSNLDVYVTIFYTNGITIS